MNKFELAMGHSGFLAVKEMMVSELRLAIESKLTEMGEDIRRVSWFSSAALGEDARSLKRAA